MVLAGGDCGCRLSPLGGNIMCGAETTVNMYLYIVYFVSCHPHVGLQSPLPPTLPSPSFYGVRCPMCTHHVGTLDTNYNHFFL